LLGGAHRAPSRTCQGAEVERGYPYQAALVEGVAGDRENDNGGE
jgi:hypothetical protein